MKRSRTALFRAGLNVMHATRAHRALAPLTGGLGVIFTLHRVDPRPPASFAPNRILTVTPDFLDSAITRIREEGLEIVSLDEAADRMEAAGEGAQRRFACLTFDDGYLDNLVHAYPVMARHEAPFAIYVATSMPEGTAEPWWLALEAAVAASAWIATPPGCPHGALAAGSVEQKYAAYEALYWWLRGLSEESRREAARGLCVANGIDMAAIRQGLAMSWDEIAGLARDPLATIGAHTVSHPALAGLSASDAEREMSASRAGITERIGSAPAHFAYPYGDPASAGVREFAIAAKLGFRTGVTTRPGMIHGGHAAHMMALPRVSLNGDYQSERYLDLFLSGAPFALWNRFRRVNAA